MGHPDTDAPPSSVAAGRAVHGHAHRGGRVDAAPAPAASDTAFDTNVVIILAALFFALVCVVGLNSLARCALRCGGRGGAAAAEGDGVASARTARRGGGGGIKRRVLRSLPVEVYGGGGEGIDDVCAICLGEFMDGEKVRVLPPCGHGFHVRCVDAWLVSHGSCPTCRRLVIEGAPAKADGCGRSRRTAETDTIAVVVV